MGGRGEGGPPGQAHAARGGPRVVWVAMGVAGEEMVTNPPPPPPEMGVKMFELAQLHLFTSSKKGGPPTCDSSPPACRGWAWGGKEYGARTWTWAPTRSALMDIGGLDPEAANLGVYAGMVHGIASRPKSKPKPAATPATGGPPHPRTPPAPGTPSPRPWGPSPPPWTGKAPYVGCVLALI